MRELIGKKILAAYLSEDKTILGFELEGGERLAYFTEGECCSRSWIEHFSNEEYLAGAVVSGVQDIDIPDVSELTEDGEYTVRYGVKVLLEGRPAFEFEFRNLSNGYYGGQIVKTDVRAEHWCKLVDIAEFEQLRTGT